MEKKKEDEANVYKEMEQVGINGNKSDQVTLHMAHITENLHDHCSGKRAGKCEAFW